MTPSYYFDSSALVKRYIKESGSDRVEAIFHKQAQCFTAGLTYCELYACFGRLLRMDVLTKKQLTGLSQAFEADWKQMTVVELTGELRERVPKVVAAAALKGGDVVQLCAALIAAEMREGLVFVVADLPLLNAARRQGLTVLNPAASE